MEKNKSLSTFRFSTIRYPVGSRLARYLRMLSQVSIEELQKSLAGPRPPKVIDIREPEEFERGHMKGAELIPLPQLAKEIHRKYPNKHVPVVLYDDLGVRSHHAARLLRALGYYNVKEVIGGYAVALAN
jgi:rhodanese-related sulfurtransferase